MRFREGDKVEFIWSGKLKQGVVTEIEETKNAISYQIKTSEINSFEELASELNAIRELLVDIASKLEITIPSTEEEK